MVKINTIRFFPQIIQTYIIGYVTNKMEIHSSCSNPDPDQRMIYLFAYWISEKVITVLFF